MNDKLKNQMIARRIAKGYNATESAKLLTEILAAHEGPNLIAALVYNGFATERLASRFHQTMDGLARG